MGDGSQWQGTMFSFPTRSWNHVNRLLNGEGGVLPQYEYTIETDSITVRIHASQLKFTSIVGQLVPDACIREIDSHVFQIFLLSAAFAVDRRRRSDVHIDADVPRHRGEVLGVLKKTRSDDYSI